MGYLFGDGMVFLGFFFRVCFEVEIGRYGLCMRRERRQSRSGQSCKRNHCELKRKSTVSKGKVDSCTRRASQSR